MYKGEISVGTAIIIIQLSTHIVGPVKTSISLINQIKSVSLIADKIDEILYDSCEDIEEVSLPKFENSIEVKNLDFSYTNDRKALNNINLTFEKYNKYAIVGESGCGKSTLVSLLMGFNQAQQGKILFNGQEIQSIDRHSFYEKVSLVSHSSYVFKGTLRENMKMAKIDATDEQIYACLEQVNLAQFVRDNGGLDMQLLSRGANISGGQIQRLALARALLHNAALYIFDEATSNIDVESEEIILQFIQQFKQQKTIVMISHRLANAVNADCINVLEQGKLIEQGTHKELMAKQGAYAEMFQQQKDLEQIREVANA